MSIQPSKCNPPDMAIPAMTRMMASNSGENWKYSLFKKNSIPLDIPINKLIIGSQMNIPVTVFRFIVNCFLIGIEVKN